MNIPGSRVVCYVNSILVPTAHITSTHTTVEGRHCDTVEVRGFGDLEPVNAPINSFSRVGVFCIAFCVDYPIARRSFEHIFVLKFVSDFRFLFVLSSKKHETPNVFCYSYFIKVYLKSHKKYRTWHIFCTYLKVKKMFSLFPTSCTYLILYYVLNDSKIAIFGSKLAEKFMHTI